MAWTQEDIDALKSAIAQGALTVRFADREVTYRSLREMRDLLIMMGNDVATTPRPKIFYGATTKGF